MNRIKLAVIAISIMVGGAALVPSGLSMAQSPADEVQRGVNGIGGNEGTNSRPIGPMIKTAINVLLFIIGTLAVIMIIFGGLKYVTSRGEASEITSARNTILYAVVGLVVAILAYAIVDFVVNAFS